VATVADARDLLRYLWQEAEVELRPVAGAKVRDAFADDDPLAVDIEAALAQPATPVGALDVERLEAAMHAVGEEQGADSATPQLYPSDAAAIAAAYRAAGEGEG
jgi:hypothetical protein